MPKYLYKKMSYKGKEGIIPEHEHLTRTLRHAIKTGRTSQLKKLLKEQSAELKEYKAEYKKKRRK